MGNQNRQKFRRQEDFTENCLEQRVPSLADVSAGTAHTERKDERTCGRTTEKHESPLEQVQAAAVSLQKIFPFFSTSRLIAFAKTAVRLDDSNGSGGSKEAPGVSASSVPRIRLGRARDSASRARHLSWSNSMEDSVLYQGHKA
jgi:hypothetical protein